MRGEGSRAWWLYGPACAGKSATAWEIYAHLLRGQPRAYFDVDQVGMCYPEPAGDPGRYALKARAAGELVGRLAQAGARTVVVSGVLEAASFPTVVARAGGVPVTFCRLRTEAGVLRERLERRYDPQTVRHVLGEVEGRDDGGLHPVVDSSDDGPRRVARQVVAAMEAATPSPPTVSAPPPSTPPAAPSAPAALSAPPSAGRAVLVCGPTGVGTSTLGFALAVRRWAAGSGCAYLDLQQIGFLRGLPSDAARARELRASCVAGLWEHYRGVGADELVLGGHVRTPGELEEHRAALGGTPLLVVRLRASRERLRERITARSRGRGPANLAGDTMRGLSATQVDAVVHRSLAQQERLERCGLADVVLDTDDVDPGQGAEELQALWDHHLAP